VTSEGEGEGDGSPSGPSSGPRAVLSEILQLGILSHLNCLQVSRDTSQSRHGNTQYDDPDAGDGEESSEEHWMKAGEREKQRTRFAAKRHYSSTERASALSSSRAHTLEAVQQFPSLGLSLSDAFGSQLICAFLTLSDDVDASLSILNILLRAGGHASDEACELLAMRLLSRRRQAMARAICRLMHSRGRLCDTSFYAFLFASILSPAPGPSEIGALADPYPMPPRGLGEQDDREREAEIERKRVRGGVCGDIDSDRVSDRDSDRVISTAVSAQGSRIGSTSPAVTEALILLDEIMQGVITSLKARANATGTADSASEPTSDLKFLKVASNLIDILSRLGYGDQGLRAVYGAIERMKRLWSV
jgi:hypothetical protein